LTHPR